MDKNNTKKLTLLLAAAMVISLCGCGNTNATVPQTALAEPPTVTEDTEEAAPAEMKTEPANTEKDAPEAAVEEPEETTDIADPLEGYDVLYPGAKTTADPAVASLIQVFMKLNIIDPSEILMVNADDFENTGEYTAFVFIGKYHGEDAGIPYEGDLWFTNGTDFQRLNTENNEWWSIDGTIKYDKRKYVYANAYYATAAVSCIYEVKNGKAEECSISYLGSAYQMDNQDVSITISAYDACYDEEMDLCTGHTWKPYYFYYDEAKDRMEEYVGTPIDKSEINDKAGFDLTAQIEGQGCEITTAFYRANGILNVNYQVEEGDFIYYKNANYDCNAKSFIDAWGTGGNTLEDSDFGGTYLSSIYSPGN